LIRGPAAVLPSDREKFGTVMPPFGTFGDEEIASLANFVRKNFGKSGGAEVTAADVSKVRMKP